MATKADKRIRKATREQTREEELIKLVVNLLFEALDVRAAEQAENQAANEAAQRLAWTREAAVRCQFPEAFADCLFLHGLSDIETLGVLLDAADRRPC